MDKISRRGLLASTAAVAAAPLFVSGQPAQAASSPARTVPRYAKAAPLPPVPMLPRVNRAAVWTSVPVDQPVVFITIDDGYSEDPVAAAMVETDQIPVTAFITFYAASSWPPVPGNPHVAYLKRFLTAGHGVQSHSKTHAHLPTKTYAEQYSEIEKARNWLSRSDMFGNVPTLFRPPYGEYNNDTLAAMQQLGFPIAVLWTHTPSDLADGVDLRPGDIILLHFTTTLSQDLTLALDKISAAGLTPAYLSDYLQ